MRIKTVPEDFIVVEKASHELVEDGKYVLLELSKRNITTERALESLADFLGVPRRFIGYAGTKDARALTRQHVSVKGDAVTAERLKHFRRDGVTVRVLGMIREPLGLGMLQGNRFEIVVRDISAENAHELRKIPNYFDEQRFSTSNALIGKLLIKSEYLAAAQEIMKTDDEATAKMQPLLEQRPNDAITALRTLPKHNLLMYVHAYQSLLYNEVLSKYILSKDDTAVRVEGPVSILVPSKDLPDISVPLFGFGTEEDSVFGKWYEEILAREELVPRDFVVRALPFLTVEGGEREAFFTVSDLEIGALEDDEMNPGKRKQRLTFVLPKGCYATMVVKCLFRTGSILGRD